MTDKPAILALDLATVTGYALRRADGSVTSGVWHLTGTQHGQKFAALYDALTALFNERFCQFELLVYEKPFFFPKAGAGNQLLAGLCACAQLFSERVGISYYDLNASTWRAHAKISKAPNKKAASVVLFTQVYGYPPADDNEADAWNILQCAIAQQGADK
jgi:hypothetical protein